MSRIKLMQMHAITEVYISRTAQNADGDIQAAAKMQIYNKVERTQLPSDCDRLAEKYSHICALDFNSIANMCKACARAAANADDSSPQYRPEQLDKRIDPVCFTPCAA
jgi:hypothetical protein